MAKSINLKPGPAVQPATRPTEPSFKVPPPATRPPGITSGQPPLPVGRPVKVIDPAKLLPSERKALQQMGWVEGQPIPETIAPAMQQAIAAAEADHASGQNMLAVDPNTPPTIFNVVPVENLPRDKQDSYNQILNQALAEQAEIVANERAAEEPSELERNLRVLPGVVEPVARPAPPFVAPDVKPAVNPKAKPAAAEPTMQELAAQNRTSEPIAPLSNCPHCAWDLAMPDQPEPAAEDKQAYLQSLLGEIPYVRDYALLGGQLTATFRTLTTREIDACFQQCHREVADKRILSDGDFMERLNRLRLYLQIQRVRSSQFDHDLPDGLDRKSNVNAKCHWEVDESKDAPSPLEQVEEFLLANVLRTETINRIMQQQCNRFNRLVARLEALVDNSDFWKRTAAAS